MQWVQASLKDALIHGNGREIVPTKTMMLMPEKASHFSGDMVCFSDGTAVFSCSDWTGPLSEVTPDIDANPPEVWIFKEERHCQMDVREEQLYAREKALVEREKLLAESTELLKNAL